MPAGSVEGVLFISSTSLGPTKARAEKTIAVGAAESIAKERSERFFVRVEFRELVEKRKFKCNDVGDLLLLLLLLLKRSDERVKALNIYEPQCQPAELLLSQLGRNMLVFASLPLLSAETDREWNGMDGIRRE